MLFFIFICALRISGSIETMLNETLEAGTIENPNEEITIENPNEETVAGTIENPNEDIVAGTIENPNEDKRTFWHRKLSHVRHVVAPMVDQSELAFRMMMRRHGAHLCFSPMFHAHLFLHDSTYRKACLASCPEDRPLIIQFCANQPETFLEACRSVVGQCDGVDLNLGCPQLIAKRGHYGAFLQEERDLIVNIVNAAVNGCPLPISCKIRILETEAESIAYAQALDQAGVSFLTVHGRTREQRGPETGLADWSRIAAIVKAVSVPVIANGNIRYLADVDNCLAKTGAAAVMSAEGILSNPLLFEGQSSPNWIVAREYLSLARQHNAAFSAVRAHLFRFFHFTLLKHGTMRTRLSQTNDFDAFDRLVDDLEALCRDDETIAEENKMPHWMCQPYVRPKVNDSERSESTHRQSRREELDRLVAVTGLSRKQLRKRHRYSTPIDDDNRIEETKKKIEAYLLCANCSNPRGRNCDLDRCRNCCRDATAQSCGSCSGHRFNFSLKIPEWKKEKKTIDVCALKERS